MAKSPIPVADIVVLGSGFAGSILALILERQGRDVLVIDKASHPRFAIGESSTPTANMVLASLARQYDLPRLEPLAKYGTWRATYPQLMCGLKRGFSYFKHTPGMVFQPSDDHANELLVAANSDDQVSDTQWLRADIDAFLATEVRQAGIRLWEETNIHDLSPHSDGGWSLTGRRDGQPIEVTAGFIVDASGAAGVVPRALGIRDQLELCQTNSRCVFGHFRNVASWQETIATQGCRTSDHPFPCDHAAQHQILDDGWLWLLRFENGVTSAGLVLDAARLPLDASRSPQEEWQQYLEAYPSLQQMFAQATLVKPPGTLVRTGRLQRRWRQIVGSNWAALPNTAGFVDPLHSTGIAHSFCGVERLAEILQQHWQRPTQEEALLRYQVSVLSELDFVDQLVAACYRGLTRFPLLVACSMLYFAAATTFEESRAAGDRNLDFLCANNPQLRAVVTSLTERLDNVESAADVESFVDELATAIRPFNTVGLCNPSARNMYHYTIAPEV
jgi:FADH2 O2-dependent halogenase